MEEKTRLLAKIEGHVQGVGFRQFVFQTAISLDLSGWVRNTYEGDVEVVAEGRQEILEILFSALHKGPRMAYVTKVSTEYQPATGEFEDFRVRSTAQSLFPSQ
jgi:acylphosphatase